MKKPIAIFLTDTHLSIDNHKYILDIFKQVINEALKKDLKIVYHLGDIFDSRKAQPQENLICFLNILEMFEENDIKLIAISGNHDKNDYGSIDSFLFPFRSEKSFLLYDKYEKPIEINKDINLWLLPFFSDDKYNEKYNSLISNIDKSKFNILGTHIGFKGAIMNSGKLIEHGPEGGEFDLTLVGHYHDRQEIVGKKIVYIGSALQHNFGENNEKGFTVLNYDEKNKKVDYEFIQSKFKEFVNIRLLNSEDFQESLIEAKKLKEQGCEVKIHIKDNKYKLSNINRNDAESLGIKCVLDIENDIIEGTSSENINKHTEETIIDEFNQWCESKNILDKEIGLKIIKESIKKWKK